jgi:hypothetical protein
MPDDPGGVTVTPTRGTMNVAPLPGWLWYRSP